MNFKILALILLAVAFVYELFLKIIAYRSKNNPVPANVADVYDAETYQKFQAYHKENSRVSIISSVVGFALNLLLFGTDFYSLVGNGISNIYLAMIAVLAVSLGIDAVSGAVFSYIYHLKIDEKYGFNKMTIKTFIADQIKSFIVSIIIFVGLMSLYTLIHTALGDWVLAVFGAILVVFIFGVMVLAPKFGKLYNNFVPLEEGELRTKLVALLEKNGYSVKEIQVMDASKRTTKSNAYFSGMGKTKTIVLYDTLVNTMTPDEIVAVFAHELGHGLHKDIAKNSVISIVQMAVLAVLAWLTTKFVGIYTDFGFKTLNYGFALLLVMAVEFPIISPAFSLVASALMRKAEYRADAHAVKEGYGEALISSLKKLSKENLAHLAPSKIEVALTYSHPTLSQRIDAIEKLMK
ncbi:MAG: M48 family metallopeptidase [Oscillospiraceae bacterium]|nr:M48 family metallopeptidase [Oscillospiraceae bacterium]